MARGTAIHIGLNRVDPQAYAGWNGVLAGCENDARAMKQLTEALGYTTRLLLSEDADTASVFGAIADAAADLTAGDVCVISYAGHGGQFADLTNDETDDLDETWLLFNREVLDDEIALALSGFADGVRVVVLSDSCHSGTVIRKAYRPGPPPRSRGAPPLIQQKVLELDRALYEHIRARTPRATNLVTAASVLLLAGCQDDQESMEDDEHGAFTAALLRTWDDGTFRGTYRQLVDAITAQLPPDQVPNLTSNGASWPAFEAQTPFTIASPSAPATGGGPGSGQAPTEGGQTPTEGGQTPTGGGPGPSGPGGYRLTISIECDVDDPAVIAGMLALLPVASDRAVRVSNRARDRGRQNDRSADGTAQNNAAALSAAERQQVRRLHESGRFNVQELAQLFSVTPTSLRPLLADPRA